MSARPAETHLWAVEGATLFISSAICRIGVAHEAIFHRLLDVLLALDFGLGRSITLLPAGSALGLVAPTRLRRRPAQWARERCRRHRRQGLWPRQHPRANIRHQGAVPNIPNRSNRKTKYRWTKVLYRERNRVERFFNRLKQFRRIATRYDKLGANFFAFVKLAGMRFGCDQLSPCPRSSQTWQISVTFVLRGTLQFQRAY